MQVKDLITENSKTDIEKAFSLFVGESTSRPWMSKPFELDGKIYATDDHALVRTEKKNIDFVLDNEHIAPITLIDIIPQVNTIEILNISNEMFEPLKTEDEYEYAGKDIECKTCEGSGQVEWEFQHYTKELDCPICDGVGLSGKKRKIKTGGKTFGKSLVKVRDAYFDTALFYRLVKVRDILGGDIELISYRGKYPGVMFKIGVCEILIMPMRLESEAQAANYDGVLNVDL